ncbi:hypothetical protein CHGG_08890 [Chaetomium globosum CBS 148.51]|uniref:Cytochrome P450 n=1 Tax=Chaetomium globosum (strain ATCC 6205 / CBS 148.51 / DSM 1962 / NBRC 6347 / NRRL 1970) TaxID=306901 RepID=Q2GT14_CHAGB|nr:uncharacterized protein CHGG_08890 [Chaetomium globosum CBS 148.51]EAQ84876.1 hypothetical protein CHGG_08890 [Chaetomium globosum CBS 148.51]
MGLVVEYGNYLVVAAALAILIRAVSRPGKAITRNGEPLRNPPNTLPLVGNGIKFLQSRWDLLSWFEQCQREFGYETAALSVPTLPPGVLIHDPKNLEFVFKNEGLFTKGDFVKRRSWDLFGNGIINADGDFWKLQRKAGVAFLNTANLRVLTDVALPQYLAESAEYLNSKADKDTVDLQHMEMHANDEFSLSFDYASGITAERFQNPLWRVTELFTGSRFRRSVAVIKSFGRRIVTSAVKDRNDQKSNSEAASDPNDDSKLDEISGSLIQSLLEALGDETTVADAALTYLSAGRDTTGQALTWTFYLLLQHPTAITKIRAEVIPRRVLGFALEKGVGRADGGEAEPDELDSAYGGGVACEGEGEEEGGTGRIGMGVVGCGWPQLSESVEFVSCMYQALNLTRIGRLGRKPGSHVPFESRGFVIFLSQLDG